MPIRERSLTAKAEPPRRLYGFVESVVDALPERPRSRLSMHLDAVDAEAFDRDPGSITEASALYLVRLMTTPRRLAQLFQLENVKEGHWLELELERTRNMPRTWLLPSTDNFTPGPPINTVRIARLDDESEQAARLRKSCLAIEATRVKISDGLSPALPLAPRRDLRITVVDVGQAACVAFSVGTQTFGYFDVGAPLFFNRRSFPRRLDHQVAKNGFVILSHWDFDHFALVYQRPQLLTLDWYAPEQPVGPNAARLQKELGRRLHFISGDMMSRNVILTRCTGTSPGDRNATGYAMRIRLGNTKVLLTGDADYQWIPSNISSGANRLAIPHHGGAGSAPPPPRRGDHAIAVASYGKPNTYRHPDESQIQAHRDAGWRIRRTAAHGLPVLPRGNRVLYP